MFRSKDGDLMSHKEAGQKGKEWGSLGIDHSGEGQNVGRAEGSKTWLECTDEEKEQRKLAGREGGKHVFENLAPTRQEEIIQVGRATCHLGSIGGEMAWQNASPEEQERRTAAGAQAFGNLSTERQDDLRQLGRENCHLGATGGKEAWEVATPEQREMRI